MQLVVLGGNGRLGREVARQAIERGHVVRAVVRSGDRQVAAGAEPIVGNPCENEFLEEVVAGSRAVISTLGPQWPSAAACQIYPRSGHALATSLGKAGVRRLIVTSSGLLFPADTWSGRVLRWVVPNIASHARLMEEAVRATDLDWTIARTDFLTMADDERCRVAVGRMPQGGGAVPRAAVARVILDALERGEHLRCTVGLSGMWAGE